MNKVELVCLMGILLFSLATVYTMLAVDILRDHIGHIKEAINEMFGWC